MPCGDESASLQGWMPQMTLIKLNPGADPRLGKYGTRRT